MDFRITVVPDRTRTKLTVKTQSRNSDVLVTKLARMIEDTVADFARRYSV